MTNHKTETPEPVEESALIEGPPDNTLPEGTVEDPIMNGTAAREADSN